MKLVADREFGPDKIVKVAGKHFKGCLFNGCTLAFDGSGGVFFENCTMLNITQKFDGAAEITVDYLAMMSSRPGYETLVRQLFPDAFKR